MKLSWQIWLGVIIWIICIVLTFSFVTRSHARDLGQWGDAEKADPERSKFIKNLMQPDSPTVSCCGDADMYYADEVHVKDGHVFAEVTDDRDDAPLGRPHVPVGTQIEIPPNKLKWDKGNPTGHNLLFMRYYGEAGYGTRAVVYCFVQMSGT